MKTQAAILERRKKKSDVDVEKGTVSGAGGELAAKLVSEAAAAMGV